VSLHVSRSGLHLAPMASMVSLLLSSPPNSRNVRDTSTSRVGATVRVGDL